MKKKFVIAILTGTLCFSTFGCGGADNDVTSESVIAEESTVLEDEVTEEVEETTTNEISSEQSVERDLPEGDYEEVGNGTLYIRTASGSTEDGVEPYLFPKPNSYPQGTVDVELWDLDGSILTYIYLDGVEQMCEQIGEGYGAYIELNEDWQVAKGEHVIEAVQFKENDTSGEIVFYRSAKFEVKDSITAGNSKLSREDYEEIGDGTFHIRTASGSTEEGIVPIIYPDKNSTPYGYVDCELYDMDGSILTYIYLDGEEQMCEQIGAGFCGSIMLEEDSQITEGEHIVEAVQYESNDTIGKMLFYRSATFEVKNK